MVPQWGCWEKKVDVFGFFCGRQARQPRAVAQQTGAVDRQVSERPDAGRARRGLQHARRDLPPRRREGARRPGEARQRPARQVSRSPMVFFSIFRR